MISNTLNTDAEPQTDASDASTESHLAENFVFHFFYFAITCKRSLLHIIYIVATGTNLQVKIVRIVHLYTC